MDGFHSTKQIWRVHIFSSASGTKFPLHLFLRSCFLCGDFLSSFVLIVDLRSLLRRFCCASLRLVLSIASVPRFHPQGYQQRESLRIYLPQSVFTLRQNRVFCGKFSLRHFCGLRESTFEFKFRCQVGFSVVVYLHFDSASEYTGRALAPLERRMMFRLKLFLLVTCTPLTMSLAIVFFQVLGMHRQKLSQRWNLESHARVFLLLPDQRSLWRRQVLRQRLLWP